MPLTSLVWLAKLDCGIRLDLCPRVGLVRSMERTVVISRIGRKGVVVIPKRFREALNLKEGSYVSIELREGAILLKPFTVRRVKLGGRVSELVTECKREELELER